MFCTIRTFIQVCTSDEREMSKVSRIDELWRNIGEKTVRTVNCRIKPKQLWSLSQWLNKTSKNLRRICFPQAIKGIPSFSQWRARSNTWDKVLPINLPTWSIKLQCCCCRAWLKDLDIASWIYTLPLLLEVSKWLTAALANFWIGLGEFKKRIAVMIAPALSPNAVT